MLLYFILKLQFCRFFCKGLSETENCKTKYLKQQAHPAWQAVNYSLLFVQRAPFGLWLNHFFQMQLSLFICVECDYRNACQPLPPVHPESYSQQQRSRNRPGQQEWRIEVAGNSLLQHMIESIQQCKNLENSKILSHIQQPLQRSQVFLKGIRLIRCVAILQASLPF